MRPHRLARVLARTKNLRVRVEGFKRQRYLHGTPFQLKSGAFANKTEYKVPRGTWDPGIHSLTCPVVPVQPCIGPSTFTTTLLRRVYYYVLFTRVAEGAAGPQPH